MQALIATTKKSTAPSPSRSTSAAPKRNPSPPDIERRWVRAKVYARTHDIRVQTLTQWRYQDRKLGLTSARPGFPIYKKVGTIVLYLDNDGETA
jgi:hypothetical protein